jgi:hypothetical protein
MIRRLLALLATAAAGLFAATPAVFAGPDPGGGVVVAPGDPGGKYGPPRVGVGVTTPGHPGADDAHPVGRTGRGSGSTCAYSPAPDLEAWSRAVPSRLPAGGQDRVDPATHLYALVCDGRPVSYVWLGAGQQAALAAPSPAELGQRAYRQLVLGLPVIRMSPAVAVPQLVRVPTWLWVDTDVWTPRSKTAAVPGLSATATARPVRVTWSTGDGARVVCRGPGTAFRAGVDRASGGSPDCGHTYLRASAGQAGGVFVVTATVEWSVSWAGGGQAGALPPLTSAATVTLRVTESQALNDE